MKRKIIDTFDSENEFEVDEPEEEDDLSDDDWKPNTAARIPRKRGRPARNTPGRKKSKVADEDDDNEDEKVLPKKKGRAKSKPETLTVRRRGTVAKIEKSKKEVEPEEDIEEKDEDNDCDVEEEEDNLDEEDGAEDEEDEEYEEEVQLNQGPSAKQAKNFTSGAFVVLKTDMVDYENPSVWKIDGKSLMQKYLPFDHNGRLLYKKTNIYSNWSSNQKELYYSAPVEFIHQTKKEHIIEFFKDKLHKVLEDPEVEKAVKIELEEDRAVQFNNYEKK